MMDDDLYKRYSARYGAPPATDGYNGLGPQGALTINAKLECNTCKATQNLKMCGGCMHNVYCSADCQQIDWANHKSDC